ncbi:zf-HC2 domain-containing protein [Brevibacillus humidisoli]|uniref:zf-HC2 domain-containing protein n=1 Tax=Brevibacillus humidisoli TaxID=2895522 RepID=UPI001E500BF1|nr:zf-HC2 domain-containing protein [Brevibacillus humidisoli]UFJ39515.1 zf-HC2 domain-containing protein [Brevibacillus humidisoli]
MQTHHILINELLPAYMEGMVSDEAKEAIEQHLTECERCRQRLKEMLDELAEPSHTDHMGKTRHDKDSADDLRFVRRMKRVARNTLAAVLAGVLLFSAASWTLGKIFTEEEHQAEELEENRELIQIDSSLVSLSPPQLEILKRSGVAIEVVERTFGQDESKLVYRYHWDSPNIDYVQEDIYWPNHLIAMDLTNNELIMRKENVSSFGHREDLVTWKLEGVRENTETIGIELPNFAIFYKPGEWETALNKSGETRIDQIVEVNQVQFYIEKADVKDSQVIVYYQQLSDVQEVGLYELSFSLVDEQETEWNKEPNIDFQISEKRTTSLPIYKDMEGLVALRLEHAALIVPGMRYKFDVQP